MMATAAGPASCRYVIWDFNGTLLDDVALCVAILNRMLQRRGLAQIGREQYLSLFGFPVADAYRRFGFDPDRWPFDGLAKEYMEEYLPASLCEVSLREGVRAALDRFSVAGLQQVVLSASHLEDLRCQIAHFGIEGYFADLLGMTDRYGAGKEAIGKAWVHRIRQTTDAHPAMVLIGDTQHDAEVARQMGASSVLVAGGHSSHVRLERAGGCLVADDIPSAAAAVCSLPGLFSCSDTI